MRGGCRGKESIINRLLVLWVWAFLQECWGAMGKVNAEERYRGGCMVMEDPWTTTGDRLSFWRTGLSQPVEDGATEALWG